MRFLGLVVSLALAAAVLAVPASSRAYVYLTSGGGYQFDIYENYGYVSNGTSNAYDSCYYLRVDGSYYYNSGGSYTTSMGGRQVELGERSTSSVMVRRMIYVPASGGDWIRYADVFRNPGTTDVTINVRYDCNLGSNTATVVVASSSGDTTMSAADTWFVTDDGTDGGGTPATGHVIRGDGPLVSPSTFTTPYVDDFEWTYDVTVPASGQVVLLTFGVQTGMRTDAQTQATSLADLPSEALEGLDALLTDIVNFQVGGAPIITIDSPTTVEEGEEIVFEAEVIDREGDTATWSWDPDGDGTFGEHVDMATFTLPAGMTEGPGTVVVGVEASDGTETRERFRTVAITNVDPVITSAAPTSAVFVGSEYRYEVEVYDPAGAADPITYTLGSAPEGMDVTSGGVISWTPTAAQRGMLFSVTLLVEDDDGGMDEQSWDLMVGSNRPPSSPTPYAPVDRAVVEGSLPTLTVENATDPDGDELEYHFRVDRVSSFESPDAVASPAVVEMADRTSWTVPISLEEGVWYWEAWASDGLVESNRRYATFVVGDAPAAVDAGMALGGDGGTGGGEMRRRDRGGCAVSTGARAPAAAWLLTLVGLLVAARRRRR